MPGPHRPHLDGTVKALAAGRITIVDRDGFTRQIAIAKIPDGVAAGVMIHAEGTVNADGVTLDATSVRIAPARPQPGRDRPQPPAGTADRPQPPAGKGDRPQPPAGDRHGPPAPPAGAPTGAPTGTPSDAPSSGS